ncbi:MAG: tetratricopeptide repeat protein [Chloroflexi bacterium]|nr:tetratricopeptide repeat protein [Chloroflexota bacterium]
MAALVALAGAFLFSACTGEPEPEPVATAVPPPVPTAAPTAEPTAEPTQAPSEPAPTPAPQPTATFVAPPAPTPTPVPPTPTPEPTPEPVGVSTYTSGVFDFSFDYPGDWDLTQEGRTVMASAPGHEADVAVDLHILTRPLDVFDYTEDVVLDKMERAHPSFLVRQTAGQRVNGMVRLVNRAESTTEDGVVTYFKIYTAAVGRVGIVFVLKGPEQAALAALEPQFDTLVRGASLPNPALEFPDLTIARQGVGTGYSNVSKAPTGEDTVFYPDTPALVAVVRFDSLGADSDVAFHWFRVDRFHSVLDVLGPTEPDADADVHWSTLTPDGELELGFYHVVVVVDGSIVEIIHYSVIMEEGAEYPDAKTFEDWAAFLLVNGEPERAVYAATKSIELDPAEAQPYIWRAEAYEEQCKIRPAIADHSRAVRLLPDNPVTVATRGHAYWYAFDYELALADFNTALELVEELPQETDRQRLRYTILKAAYHNNRALVRVNLLQIGEALDDINVSIELEPDEHNYLDTRAYVYYKGGRYEEAKADYTRALDLGFENLYVYLGHGLTQIALGDREEGRANLELGLELFDDYQQRDCPNPQLGDLLAEARSTLQTLAP